MRIVAAVRHRYVAFMFAVDLMHVDGESSQQQLDETIPFVIESIALLHGPWHTQLVCLCTT